MITYEQNAIKLKRKQRITGKVIKSYTPERVSVLDMSSFYDQLYIINNAVSEVITEIEEVIEEILDQEAKDK